ncbi:hypothetical protein J1N35_029575 [Gossypium stocksii]|uniref:Uncharacterized protein n=1 Tax=Gossypium stocksii TaxID=47602 RepID=A0A9D3UYA8_9ROSI|nr:hypothetical protein J1N35_029575 [Gossypium stocksii]
MVNAHAIDLAYFIAHAMQHQTKRRYKSVISMGPYITRLARHFGLLKILAQTSSYTLIGQMSPQSIQIMHHMRMIERRPGGNPFQYWLIQEDEDSADIPDDVPPPPPPEEDAPTEPPPPPRRPSRAAATYADLSECFLQFEQQCF